MSAVYLQPTPNKHKMSKFKTMLEELKLMISTSPSAVSSDMFVETASYIETDDAFYRISTLNAETEKEYTVVSKFNKFDGLEPTLLWEVKAKYNKELFDNIISQLNKKR